MLTTLLLSLRMKNLCLLYSKQFRFSKKDLVPNRTKLRLRPCGWGPGKTGPTSHLASHGLKRLRFLAFFSDQ